MVLGQQACGMGMGGGGGDLACQYHGHGQASSKPLTHHSTLGLGADLRRPQRDHRQTLARPRESLYPTLAPVQCPNTGCLT